jgi:hypothetical protein
MSEQSEDVTADVGGQLFLGRIDYRGRLLLASDLPSPFLSVTATGQSSLPKFFFGFPFSGFFLLFWFF